MADHNEICSFCEKPRTEIAKLVVSDKGVSICDECLVGAFAVMTGSGLKYFKLKEKPSNG